MGPRDKPSLARPLLKGPVTFTPWCPMNLPPKRLRVSIFALLTLWLTLAVALDRYGLRAPPVGPYDVIIVAGCRVHPSGQPSDALARRAERAVALWRQGLAPQVIFTGGVGAGGVSEAAAAARHAESLGLPASAIRLEDQSRSTEENARYASSIAVGARVIVVSDAYHVWRAERVFGRYFPEVRGVGSVGPWSARLRGAAREVVAVAAYGLRGRL